MTGSESPCRSLCQMDGKQLLASLQLHHKLIGYEKVESRLSDRDVL